MHTSTKYVNRQHVMFGLPGTSYRYYVYAFTFFLSATSTANSPKLIDYQVRICTDEYHQLHGRCSIPVRVIGYTSSMPVALSYQYMVENIARFIFVVSMHGPVKGSDASGFCICSYRELSDTPAKAGSTWLWIDLDREALAKV